MTLVGKTGERVVFGCSRRIRHTLAPDHSSLTFAAKEDLINHWIVAITFDTRSRLDVGRARPVSFEMFRKKRFSATTPRSTTTGASPSAIGRSLRTASDAGAARLHRGHTTAGLSGRGRAEVGADAGRGTGRDAVSRTSSSWTTDVRATLRAVHRRPRTSGRRVAAIDLPVTTPPAQVPRIVSAGLALSSIGATATYSVDGSPPPVSLAGDGGARRAIPTTSTSFGSSATRPIRCSRTDASETITPPEESPLPDRSGAGPRDHPGGDRRRGRALGDGSAAPGGQQRACTSWCRCRRVSMRRARNCSGSSPTSCASATRTSGRPRKAASAAPLRTTGVQHPAPDAVLHRASGPRRSWSSKHPTRRRC